MKRLGLILLTLALLAAVPAQSAAQVTVGIGINFGPPAIPVYAQPPAPAPNSIWTPGYWAWGPSGYYWVPGTWVMPPAPGLVWTPGYWAYNNNAYYWNAGYWAPQVGFYGGINYGYGYYGDGYVGGEWQGPVYRYNTAVTNVNRTIIRNVYVDKTVVVVNNVNRISYNGGPNGVDARPTLHDEWVEHMMHHDPATATQVSHEVAAADDRELSARVNHGKPNEPAVDHPLTTENHPATTEHHPAAEQHPSSTGNHPNTITEPARHVEESRPVGSEHHNAPAPVHNEPAHAQQHEQHVPTGAHPSEEHHNATTHKPAPRPHATRAPRR